MKANDKLRIIFAAAALGSLAVGSRMIVAAPASLRNDSKSEPASPGSTISLKFGHRIPLTIQSSGVKWKGSTYHLVSLSSIQFELDKQTSRLKAEVKAGVMGFDSVDYDVSAAVFGSDGKLLGVARGRCAVEAMWVGTVLTRGETINLDFGVSLDYSDAAAFMVSISKRKVLTPDEWKK